MPIEISDRFLPRNNLCISSLDIEKTAAVMNGGDWFGSWLFCHLLWSHVEMRWGGKYFKLECMLVSYFLIDCRSFMQSNPREKFLLPYPHTCKDQIFNISSGKYQSSNLCVNFTYLIFLMRKSRVQREKLSWLGLYTMCISIKICSISVSNTI